MTSLRERDETSSVRQSVWRGSLPLRIELDKADCRTYDESDPYLIHFERLSYLGLLIPRLHAFFADRLIFPDINPTEAWLSFERVPLKWHYPLGLLYDLYSGTEPAGPVHTEGGEDDVTDTTPLQWKLTVHFSEYPKELVKLDADGKILHDLYINSVKEADYLRNGNGRTVMSLSEKDSTQLWDGVRQHDSQLFQPINQKLLNPSGVTLRHLPVKLYLPHASSTSSSAIQEDNEAAPGSLRVVQALITPSASNRQPQTIGTALNQILPELFPSRRQPLLAQAVLHGSTLPLTVSVEELVRAVAYLDGWLHVAVVMMA
ncbi:autophagy protein 5 [Amniculicola lignicola CBS 123094]|uniref:Autophagy protein 5 n=1 Tax=Amniculicola lignicola CBS 123094 TaxID=1392246 RepID=A0A6A5W7Z3_9PLEO|nr:autophagy protein 5 [Amniculicola lignicola CBS 123094]